MPITADEASDFRVRLRNAEEKANVADGRIGEHEAVCAERYAAIGIQFKAVNTRLNLILALVGIGTLAMLFGPKEALHAVVHLLGAVP